MEKETPKIFSQMGMVMDALDAVAKNQKNTQQGFSFRGIDQFLNTLHPIFAKVGIFLMPEIMSHSCDLREVMRSSGKTGIDKHVSLTVKYRFVSEIDGSEISATICSEGLDSGDKATNKALSAALKYALIQVFTVPTEDIEDADRTSPEIERPAAVSSTVAPAANNAPIPPKASRDVLMANFMRLMATISQGQTKEQKTKMVKDLFGCTVAQIQNWSEKELVTATNEIELLIKTHKAKK